MNKQASCTLPPAFSEQEACQSISDMLGSRTVVELKANTKALLQYAGLREGGFK